MIDGAIEPSSDGTVELSMKTPMPVSKPADLGRGSRTVRLRIEGNKEAGDTVFTQVRALLMEVTSCLIDFDEYRGYKS